jgi:uroporphyrinogen decarboxylase
VPDALGYVFDAVRLIRRELGGRVPLIGFAGAPWTLMAYMVEGGGSKGFSKARAWLYAEPEGSRRLLDLLADVTAEYLVAQADAGAQVLQLFDSHAGELSRDHFSEFALPTLARVAERVKAAHPGVPLITFARGAHHSLPAVAATAADVVGLDYTLDPAAARRAVGAGAAVQGNLDPAALYAPPAEIRARVRTMIDGFRTPELGLRGWIANLGHGMHPDHDPEHARAFVDAVHELSAGRSDPA